MSRKHPQPGTDDASSPPKGGHFKGGKGADDFHAGEGRDHLDGGRGADHLHGGGGDDSVIGGAGNDSVEGGSGNDSLDGGTGNDWIDGGVGDDTLSGGAGNDVYIVDSAKDQVVETLAGRAGGLDTVRASVDYKLGDNVENLVLAGSADLGGTGNALRNVITGNDGANRLDGGAGGDMLAGGAGADTFVFSTLPDRPHQEDRILDFKTGEDHLEFSAAVFTTLGAAGVLSEELFYAGTKAAAADDHLVYDQASGRLCYDADGSGSGKAVLLAVLGKGTELHASDIVIV